MEEKVELSLVVWMMSLDHVVSFTHRMKNKVELSLVAEMLV